MCKYVCALSRVFMCVLRAQTGPIDLLRAAVVVMVTEEEERKISDLLSLETEVLTEYRTHTQARARTHTHTKPTE